MNNSGTFNPFEEAKPKSQHYGSSGTTTTTVYNDPTVNTDIIDNFEPFAQQSNPVPASGTSKPNQSRVEDLERMQRDLERREKDLEAAERKAQQTSASMESIKNFPPFPSFCCIKPCYYQNIDVEIPESFRVTVKMCFILWMVYSIVMLINIFGTMAFFITTENKSSGGGLFGSSILILLFIPLSYVLWFRPIYRAFRTNSSFSFFLFFFVFGAQIIILVIQVLGIQFLGSCGWIISLQASNMGVRIFMVVIASLFTAILAFSVYFMVRINYLFRTTGASYEQAKREVIADAATNQTVRTAVISAAKSNY